MIRLVINVECKAVVCTKARQWFIVVTCQYRHPSQEQVVKFNIIQQVAKGQSTLKNTSTCLYEKLRIWATESFQKSSDFEDSEFLMSILKVS